MATIGPILVLCEHPVIAALVGLLVELTGHRPVFANPDEQPSDAMHRVRPLAVVLIDAEMDASRSDLFFALAARKRAAVGVFGSSGRTREIAEVAARRKIPWFTLPPDLARLSAVIELARGQQVSGRLQERRRPAETMVAADGSCILRDTSGRHWIVYDRRGADRRTSDGAPDDRVFVAEDGETRHLEVRRELQECAATELEDQLARSLR